MHGGRLHCGCRCANDDKWDEVADLLLECSMDWSWASYCDDSDSDSSDSKAEDEEEDEDEGPGFGWGGFGGRGW